MAYKKIAIAQLVKDIYSNNYVLPSIQREYVWGIDQIEEFFDSLMRGYPIGTFLFWQLDKKHIGDYNFYRFLSSYDEFQKTRNEVIDIKGIDSINAVLDGQQRMTSIYIALKGSYTSRKKGCRIDKKESYTKKKLYLNLNLKSKSMENDEEKNKGFDDESNFEYEFKFLEIKDFKTNECIVEYKGTYWFEVGSILNFDTEKSLEDYIEDKKRVFEESNYSKNELDTFEDVLKKLYKTIYTDELIVYFLETSNDLDKVLNIFVRVNSGGTKLGYSDLLLSIATAQWEHLDAREEIIKLVDEINAIGDGFNISKDLVLKSALVLSGKSITYKVKNFTRENMLDIEKMWDNISKSLVQSFKLVSSFGYSSQTLTADNAIIPIAHFLFKKENPNNFIDKKEYLEDRKKIHKWLIASLLKKSFGGQADTLLNQLRDIIDNNYADGFPYEKIKEELKENKSIVFTEADIDELLNKKYGKSEAFSVLSTLYPNINFNEKYHMDHMYPKSKFKRKYLQEKGISVDNINKYIDNVDTIANLQFLKGVVNEEKLNKDFNDWFNDVNKSDKEKENYRKDNYLPDMDYTYENFLDFITERRKKLKEKLIEILIEDKDSIES